MAIYTHITASVPQETLLEIKQCLAFLTVCDSVLRAASDDPQRGAELVCCLRSVGDLVCSLSLELRDEIDRAIRSAT